MSIKSERLGSQIQRELGEILQKEVKDSKIGFVTVTGVDVTNDLSIATVYVTILGGDNKTEAALKAIERAKGFIRTSLGKRIQVRKIPDLRFKYDESNEYGNKIDSILEKLKQD